MGHREDVNADQGNCRNGVCRLSLSLLLISGGCDSKSSSGATPDAKPAPHPRAVATGLDGMDVGQGDALLGGGAGDDPPQPGVMAGPLEQQSLIDYGQHSIGAWGPVMAIIMVPSTGGGTIAVNRLSSPDPFTPTYQFPDGEIVTTNTPLSVLLAPGYTPVDPPIVAWTEPESGETIHLYDGTILVYFKPEVTQSQIEQVIAQNNLRVIMSWFEPADEGGTGNSIAWFQFGYSPLQFADFSAAYSFFNAHPLVSLAMPDSTDELKGGYCDAQGSNVPWPTDMLNITQPGSGNNYTGVTEAYYVNTALTTIPLGPEAGGTFSSQVVAVLDSGVYRQHKDFITGLSSNPGPGNSLGIKGKISWIGVDVTADGTWVGTKQKLRGEPEFYDSHQSRQGLVMHGTAMAGMISAGTRNPSSTSGAVGTGTSSLAPSALILPVRMKVTGVINGKSPIFSNASIVKAIRALFYHFGHWHWREKVRVVNMSFSGSKTPWWMKNDMKGSISQDLKSNDRLYVAGAGNDGAHVLSYPAAHSNVLGVTGAIAHRQLNGTWRFSANPNSNYWDLTSPMDNSAYPISGSYSLDNSPNTVLYPQDTYSGHQAFPIPPGNGMLVDDALYYAEDGGTSSATAQVSALAFLLYDARVRQTGSFLASSYPEVRHRIVHQRMANMSWNGDSNHTLSGTANYIIALNGW
jgi:hypothetical protein